MPVRDRRSVARDPALKGARRDGNHPADGWGLRRRDPPGRGAGPHRENWPEVGVPFPLSRRSTGSAVAAPRRRRGLACRAFSVELAGNPKKGFGLPTCPGGMCERGHSPFHKKAILNRNSPKRAPAREGVSIPAPREGGFRATGRPPPANARLVPAPTGRTGQRSAFPCLSAIRSVEGSAQLHFHSNCPEAGVPSRPRASSRAAWERFPLSRALLLGRLAGS